MLLSIVIPCYNCENNIESVIKEIDSTFQSQNYDYEVVLVNDCSKDKTINVIKKLARTRKNIVAVDLARNSGQYPALMAGFSVARGDIIATCEDDGQTELSVFPEMISKLDDEHDVITQKYLSREQPSGFRRLGTKIAGLMSKWMIPKPEGVSFSITFVAKRYVIEEMMKYDQPYPFIEGLIFRTTHKVGNVETVQRGRASGSSGYNLRKLFELWLNGFTSFSIKPLRLSVFFGAASAAVGFIYAITLILKRIITKAAPAGWTSIIVIMLVMFGIVLMVLGMIGEYLGRLYMSVNKTPQYVIREVVGLDSENEE